MVVWRQQEEGVWAERVRVGDVGGNTLGFLGCDWGPAGDKIIGHSFSGAFHLWREREGGQWESEKVFSLSFFHFHLQRMSIKSMWESCLTFTFSLSLAKNVNQVNVGETR